RTETWVADRTGHKSSQMINRYRRAARSASELGLGELSPMVDSVPELGQSSPRDCPKRVVQRTKKRYQPSDITTESRSGGMADAADSKASHRVHRATPAPLLPMFLTREATRKITLAHPRPTPRVSIKIRLSSLWPML